MLQFCPTLLQALASRDALAKLLYESLFNRVVCMLNGTLCTVVSPRKSKAHKSGPAQDELRFIAVLDIYGHVLDVIAAHFGA